MKRSGNVSYGETLIEDIRKNKVFAVIIAADIGETSKKKIIDKSIFYRVPYFVISSKEEQPSTSIFIGPYQFAVIAAFAIYDISKETALAISLVEQAIVIIVTSLIAVLFLLKNNISYKELKEDIK